MNEEDKRNEIKSTTDFMPNLTHKVWDNFIYLKHFDFITGGRAFVLKYILAVILELLLSFVILIIFLGTQWFFVSINYAIVPSLVFIVLVLLVMSLTLVPKHDKSLLSYVLNYGKTIKPKIKSEKKKSYTYKSYTRIEPKGVVTYFLVITGRISEVLFEDEILAERERLATERNDLNGITVTNTKCFVNQTFAKQKLYLKQIIDNTNDEDLELFAKRYMQIYSKRLNNEKVERQFLTFRTHNDEERERLAMAISNWEDMQVITVDRELSEEKIREVL